MQSLSAMKVRLSWMLGTASVLFASRAWAQGAENALGVLFGMATAVLVLGGLFFAMGLVMLVLNLTGRHGTFSLAVGMLSGLGKVMLGLGLGEVLLRGNGDGLMEAILWGVVLLGAGEIVAAVRATRSGSNRRASPETAQD
ncbi:hypothetical protein [Corallococcus exercitus]|uniref:hypothetical protein n=1 Tax=Corallococcus exercitus TaxID=2316736 RepID=UPI0035D496E5